MVHYATWFPKRVDLNGVRRHFFMSSVLCSFHPKRKSERRITSKMQESEMVIREPRKRFNSLFQILYDKKRFSKSYIFFSSTANRTVY